MNNKRYLLSILIWWLLNYVLDVKKLLKQEIHYQLLRMLMDLIPFINANNFYIQRIIFVNYVK